jgi:Protein of unknown function (DUF2971)
MSDLTIYHYTSIAGCAAIIQSRSIWLTDHRFLNDKHELQHAFTSFLAHFTPEEQESFARAYTTHGFNHHYCVFSLSRSPEILSQWRAYADDGRGVAMGFNSPFLKYAGIELAQCQYEDHDKYIRALARKYRAAVKAAHRSNSARPSEMYEWVRDNAVVLQELTKSLISLKNPAFVEEREIRGIMPALREDMRIRVAGSSMIPYTAIRLWDEKAEDRARDLWVALPELWFGPKCSDLNRIAFELLGTGMCSTKSFDCGYV